VAVSDEQLMRLAARGDVQAFGTLYDRYQPRLLAFLTRFTGDVTVAQDLTQDTFWRAWEYRETFRNDRPFSAWIYTIARNAAVSELRRAHRHFVPLDPELSTGFDDQAERLSLREQVRSALRQLPYDQRMCLILREYEGFSHAEIAGVVGCSEGAVRVISYRARRALAKLLRPLLENEDCRVG
jgi:RNA polymerase sigma-70 factor, ECF subfamily